MFSRRSILFAAVLTASTQFAGLVPAHAQQTIINVSYDPTRELYREFNTAFAQHWQETKGETIRIQNTHSGSGQQARAVIDGLEADVVTLALEADIDAIVKATGKIREDWRGTLANNNSPYTSTIVFLVRKGNPKNLLDWGDLVKEGVEVITPNPKSSGGARWNFLAAWAWGLKEFGGDVEKTTQFVGDLYRHVPVLDPAARGSTTTFVQRGIGDVLLAWENEAFLAIEELGPDAFDIVVPSLSILAEPPVAVVDANVDAKGTREVATAYLEYLYSEVGQNIAAKNYYRPFSTEGVDPAELERFPDLELVTIDDLGGWAKVQPEFFGDGGVFDKIYQPGQ
ncbi:MAG: sulfate ABC transporter substrate-binding protein [Aquamicrobium sp.]|nr:sulfate ABC transporter substrate-binding protein [Aquamicrobium sp.]